MSFSLYEATIPSLIQISTSVSKLVDKASAFCTENNIGETEITLASLAQDMLPFAYQITSVSHHSIGAIEGIRKGVFSPDMTAPPQSFDELKQIINDAITGLKALEPEVINAFVGKDVQFKMADFSMDFCAENFLLSFSQANFYFHATTAYDILRHKGLPLGKRDFLGAVNIKK